MINLPNVQAIANGYMTSTVVINHKTAPAMDPSDRTGDHLVTFTSPPTTTRGWFVDRGTHTFSGGRGVFVTDRPTLRVPVGTPIHKQDEVTIDGGHTWVVVDASSDETWPIWTKAELVRIE